MPAKSRFDPFERSDHDCASYWVTKDRKVDVQMGKSNTLSSVLMIY